MSTRERWVVYPLLFLTLGIALRDKVIPPAKLGNRGMRLEAATITTPRIRCNELQVGEVVCDRVDAKQSECRTMLVKNADNRPVVVVGSDNKNRAGLLETFTANGMRQVRLLSSDVGGMVTTIERGGKLALILGDSGQNFGLFAELPGSAQLIPLTIPWPIGARPSAPKPIKPTGNLPGPETK
jgi:hypothetical protein